MSKTESPTAVPVQRLVRRFVRSYETVVPGDVMRVPTGKEFVVKQRSLYAGKTVQEIDSMRGVKGWPVSFLRLDSPNVESSATAEPKGDNGKQ